MGTLKAAVSDEDGDEELERAFAKRDKHRVVTLLMRRHGTRIYRYAVTMTSDHSLAEEVRQQVFTDAYRDLDQVSEATSLKHWIFGIAHHRCLDAVNSRKRWYQRYKNQPPEGPELDDDYVSPAPDQLLERAQFARILWKCIDKLPSKIRSTIVLRYGQELRYDDVAAMVGERSGAVQRRVARAIPLLRRCLQSSSYGGAR